MRVIVRRSLTHLCPHVDEVDAGDVWASWTGDAVELHALARHLDGYRGERVSHEDVTVRIGRWITEAGGQDVRVSTSWRTAGLDVVVTSDGGDRALPRDGVRPEGA